MQGLGTLGSIANGRLKPFTEQGSLRVAFQWDCLNRITCMGTADRVLAPSKASLNTCRGYVHVSAFLLTHITSQQRCEMTALQYDLQMSVLYRCCDAHLFPCHWEDGQHSGLWHC